MAVDCRMLALWGRSPAVQDARLHRKGKSPVQSGDATGMQSMVLAQCRSQY